MVAIGDSKTLGLSCCTGAGGYRDELEASLDALGTNDFRFLGVYAIPAKKVGQFADEVVGFVGGFNEAEKVPAHVLINLGTNDLGGIVSPEQQAEWKTDLGFILDTLHTKWPTASVYVALPYLPSQIGPSDLMDDTLIPDVLSTRSAWAFVGPDERSFLPGHIDGDAIHPDAVGYTLTAVAWQTVMGY